MVTDAFRKDLRGTLIFLGSIWCTFLLSRFLPWDVNSLGLRPRTLPGLVGIPLMPFLHANFTHLISNTVPLFVLLLLLASTQAKSIQIVIANVLIGGALLWLVGRPAIHVGASGLIYGLSTFLIVYGFRERTFVPIAVSILVVILYGGTLLSGIVPGLRSHESWDGHLCGAIAGGFIAVTMTRRRA